MTSLEAPTSLTSQPPWESIPRNMEYGSVHSPSRQLMHLTCCHLMRAVTHAFTVRHGIDSSIMALISRDREINGTFTIRLENRSSLYHQVYLDHHYIIKFTCIIYLFWAICKYLQQCSIKKSMKSSQNCKKIGCSSLINTLDSLTSLVLRWTSNCW